MPMRSGVLYARRTRNVLHHLLAVVRLEAASKTLLPLNGASVVSRMIKSFRAEQQLSVLSPALLTNHEQIRAR